MLIEKVYNGFLFFTKKRAEPLHPDEIHAMLYNNSWERMGAGVPSGLQNRC